MKKYLTLLIAVIFCAGMSAAENLLRDPGFEQPEHWRGLDKTYSFESGSGRNFTGALVCRRSDPKLYTVPYQTVKLTPGKTYRFGVWVKTEGRLNGGGAAVCMEFFTPAGDWVNTITAPDKVTEADDWKFIEGTFRLPQTAEYEKLIFRYSCYLSEKSTGTVYFDNGLVEETEDRCELSLVWPMGRKIYQPDGMLRFSGSRGGEGFSPQDCGRMTAEAVLTHENGKTYRQTGQPGTDGVFELRFGNLPEGKARLHAVLRRTDPQKLLAELKTEVRVVRRPERGVIIDEANRLTVDGKAVMPLGLYVYVTSRRDLDVIADSPFDTILPYNSLDMQFDGAAGTPEENVKAVLDYLNRRQLKIIFSLTELLPQEVAGPTATRRKWGNVTGQDEICRRVIEVLKDHPALLAWYMCDETDVAYLKNLIQRRTLITEADSAHPVLGVFYQQESITRYMDCCDLLGVDPYPVKRNRFNSMESIDAMFQTVQRTRMPLLGVPQIFNSGIYDPAVRKGDTEKFFRDYRYPTEIQMKAMALREVIGGAKGLIFYSFFDLYAGPEGRKQFERRWPEVCRTGKLLRRLEPYILSVKPAPELQTAVHEGKVAARAFRAEDGRVCVMVTASGPGKAEAVLTLPPNLNRLVSESGRIRNLGGGKYIFRGQDIDYDVLLEN